MSFYNPYIIYDVRSGQEICQCSSIQDAMLMVSFQPNYRKYKQRKLILDQIVDITSEKLPDDRQLSPQRILNESTAVPFKG